MANPWKSCTGGICEAPARPWAPRLVHYVIWCTDLLHVSFLGASPDASIYDPFSFAEIKCYYKYQDVIPSQAADFMLHEDEDGRFVLTRSHVYFSQLQGQMAIGRRKWCDLIFYMKKGISV